MFLGLCLITPLPAAISASSSWFQIQGEDATAVDFTRKQALLLEAWIPRYFSAPSSFEPAVRCFLVDDSSAEKQRPFEIRATDRDQVILRFSTPALDRPETLALALVQSFLVRRQIWTTGDSRLHQIPQELFVAAAAAFRESQQPYCYALSSQSARPQGTGFLNLDFPDTPRESTFVDGYYQWEFGKALAGSHSAFQELLHEQLQGSNSLQGWMERAGYPVPEPAAEELLWQTWLAARIQRQAGPVFDVETSRDFFFDLQQITIRVGEERIRAGLADLWDYRNHSWLESEQERRTTQLKRILPQVNPVFFNTFHSLGKVLESLEGNRRSRFQEAVDQLARDLEVAENHARILQAGGF